MVMFQFFRGAAVGKPIPPPVTTRRHPGYDARAGRLRAIRRDDEEILALIGAAIRTLQ